MTEEVAPESGAVDHFATNVSVSSDDISDLAGGVSPWCLVCS